MIIIGGHIRVKPEAMDTLRPHMRTVLETTRKENGCILYAFGEDVLDPGLIRIVERWESWDALMTHIKTAHLAAWNRELENVGGVLGPRHPGARGDGKSARTLIGRNGAPPAQTPQPPPGGCVTRPVCVRRRVPTHAQSKPRA